MVWPKTLNNQFLMPFDFVGRHGLSTSLQVARVSVQDSDASVLVGPRVQGLNVNSTCGLGSFAA